MDMPGGMRGGGYVGGRAWQIPRDTVNERAVCILLECILVHTLNFLCMSSVHQSLNKA